MVILNRLNLLIEQGGSSARLQTNNDTDLPRREGRPCDYR